jgi:hypothetical protein
MAVKIPKFQKGEVWFSKSSDGILFRTGKRFKKFVFVEKKGNQLPRFKREDGALCYFHRNFLFSWDLLMRKPSVEEEADFLLEQF